MKSCQSGSGVSFNSPRHFLDVLIDGRDIVTLLQPFQSPVTLLYLYQDLFLLLLQISLPF